MKLQLKNWMISAGRNLPEEKKGIISKSFGSLGGFLNLGERKLSGEKTISDKLIEAYAGWVYINSSVLAEEVSRLDVKLYQTGYSQGQLEMQEIVTHEVLDLLDRFNDSTTSSDGFFMTESHLNLTGDAFWFTPLNNGKPTDIFPLRPDKIEVKLGDVTDSSRRVIEGYVYKDKIDGKNVEIEYPVENIIQFKVPNPGNMYRGKSTVEAVANDIDIDTYAGKTLREFFENGMIVQFALSTEQRLNNDQITNFQSQLRAAYGGAKNAWKVPIFGGGIKPVELQMSSKDMQLIEQMKWLRDKIMIAFKNTPASIGIIEDVNRANSESTLNNWKASVIKSKMQRIVDVLNEFLLPKYGDNLILGFENPAQDNNSEDRKDAGELYKQGILTKNEAREMIGFDAIDGGDDFYVQTPLGLIPRSVANVNYKSVFRRQGIYKEYQDYKKFYDDTLPMMKQRLLNKRKKEEPKIAERPKYSFDLEKVDKYAATQLKIVDHHEQIFANAVEQLINRVVEDGLTNLDDPASRKASKLVDKKKWLNESVNKLEPILTQVLIQAGNQAYRLIDFDQPYIPKAIKAIDAKEFLRDQILLFMGSAIDTDVDVMVAILADGLEEELSINQIRRNIIDKFSDFNKSQAERITRTEVIKTSNLGAQDAFEQSGVVEGKQWLATEDDRTDEACLELDGKIVELDNNYFEKGDKFMGIDLSYSDVGYPPLHPNCRCVILPVIVGEKSVEISRSHLKADIKAQDVRIKELEAQIDKRTKAFRELKQQVREEKADDTAYIKALEKLTGVEDETPAED